ncbi:T9SS type A sorting domain-containing protein [Aequorivita marisscotiae]|uniref:T9SS type A sorting domain-containing protein n=1 Tax=Aequorivita marisscotiae TaxID=3040348 RepID=A0ABY8KST8_9FLAO|nr:T9SS type A sorting domain-containing protein [Aequorivita sp. Ant34-E75]WGF92102.1 T9SS type A sorting domain-containing protein [Aequorivita sp. Ant34-E75]
MKNLLLFSIFLLTTVSVFAQLTVKPNGTTDSYIYVKDQVLFVKNEVNLTRNISLANGTTDSKEASIYLRDNGQLIQGNDADNKGNGQISVQQKTDPTNAWAYYYWCSPVGNPGSRSAATPDGSQNFGVGLFYEPLPNTSVTAARQVETTTGLNGYTVPQLTISTRWLYTLPDPGTEAEGNYQGMGSNYAAPAGFGFTMKGVNDDTGSGTSGTNHDQIYEFRGRPNNGDFSIPVQGPAQPQGTNDPFLVNARMTLTGNPYPSALDLNRVFFEPGNEALTAFYFYDEDRTVDSHYYSQKPFGYGVYLPMVDNPNGDPSDPVNTSFESGNYVKAPFYIWNANGGATGTSGSGNTVLSHRFAPIGQGLMFVGRNANIDYVKIKNSHRRYIKEGASNHSIFHRPENNTNDATDNENNADRNTNLSPGAIADLDYRMPQMRLYAVFDKKVTRDLLIVFSDQATDGYDRGMDGLSPTGLATDAFFPIGPDNARLPYVINGTNYVPEKYIPIAFKIRNTSLIELRLVEEINQPYERAYLYDSQENTYKQLNGATLARVTLTLPPGTYDNRFFIFFRGTNRPGGKTETELDIKSSIAENVSFFQNNKSRQLEVRNPEGYVIKSASVFDMSGKLIINEKNLGSKSQYSFYTGNLSSGVYLVKLVTDGDVAIDYKAVVHND